MDTQTAQALLQRIAQAKQAEANLPSLPSWEDAKAIGSSLYNNLPSAPNVSKYLPALSTGPNTATAAVQQHLNAKLKSDANRDIIKALLLGAGGGAALRGAAGLSNMMSEPSRAPSTQRIVDMPIPYPETVPNKKPKEKRAGNDNATSRIGLDYYIPSMVLGTGLATYGGWKGVDALLNRQRRKQTDDELEQAKQEYEKSLLGAYKKATDSALDQVFGHYTKTAGLGATLDSLFPNVSGAAKGLGLTYALTAGPAGYMVVDKMMKSNSKRALLQKAMKERARRQALTQPPEIYAIPQPQEEESE